MNDFKQIGNIRFFCPDKSEKMFEKIQNICNGIEEYVSYIKCFNDSAEIQFKYSPYIYHYSVRCVFNQQKVLYLNKIQPARSFIARGIPFTDYKKYKQTIDDEQKVFVLFKQIHNNLDKTFNNFSKK